MTRSVAGGYGGFGGKYYIRLQSTIRCLVSSKPNLWW